MAKKKKKLVNVKTIYVRVSLEVWQRYQQAKVDSGKSVNDVATAVLDSPEADKIIAREIKAGSK